MYIELMALKRHSNDTLVVGNAFQWSAVNNVGTAYGELEVHTASQLVEDERRMRCTIAAANSWHCGHKTAALAANFAST